MSWLTDMWHKTETAEQKLAAKVEGLVGKGASMAEQAFAAAWADMYPAIAAGEKAVAANVLSLFKSAFAHGVAIVEQQATAVMTGQEKAGAAVKVALGLIEKEGYSTAPLVGSALANGLLETGVACVKALGAATFVANPTSRPASSPAASSSASSAPSKA